MRKSGEKANVEYKLLQNMNMEKIRTHKELKVYQLSFEAGMEVYKISKLFPKEETYSLTDQIRRSSRSVSGNLAEAFRKRRYPKSFIAKLTDSEGEAAETQVWLDYSLACDYLDKNQHSALFDKYDHILGMIVNMANNPDKWSL
jgi:four helix bundle protein